MRNFPTSYMRLAVVKDRHESHAQSAKGEPHSQVQVCNKEASISGRSVEQTSVNLAFAPVTTYKSRVHSYIYITLD